LPLFTAGKMFSRRRIPRSRNGSVDRLSLLSKCLIKFEEGELESKLTTDTNHPPAPVKKIGRRRASTSQQISRTHRPRRPAESPRDFNTRLNLNKVMKSFTNLPSIQRALHPRPVHLVYDGKITRKLTPLSQAVSRKLSRHVCYCKDQKCIQSFHELHFTPGVWQSITEIALQNSKAFSRWKASHKHFITIDLPLVADEPSSKRNIAPPRLLLAADVDSYSESSELHESELSSEDSSESDEPVKLSPPDSSCFCYGKDLSKLESMVEYRDITCHDYKRQGRGKIALQLVGRDGSATQFPLFAEDKLGLGRKYQSITEKTACEDYDTDEDTIRKNVTKTVRSVREAFRERTPTN
jgi:hypothetical protein